MRESAINVALDEVSPLTVKGSNRVRQYWRDVGPAHYTEAQIAWAAEHSAWCAIFVMWCLNAVGLVPAGVRWRVGGGFVRENKLPEVSILNARQGDVCIFGPPLWHHAIFWAPPGEGNKVLTIDGNAGIEGCVKVCRRPMLKGFQVYSIEPWIEKVLAA